MLWHTFDLPCATSRKESVSAGGAAGDEDWHALNPVSNETDSAKVLRAERIAIVRRENQLLKNALLAAQQALYGADGADAGVGAGAAPGSIVTLSVRSNSRRRSFEVPIESSDGSTVPPG